MTMDIESVADSSDAAMRRRDLGVVALVDVGVSHAMYRRYLSVIEDAMPELMLSAQKLLAAALVYCAYYWNVLAHQRSLQNLVRRLSDCLLPAGIRELRGSPDARHDVVELLEQVQTHPALQPLRRVSTLTTGLGGRLSVDLIAERLFPALSAPSDAFEETARRMRSELLKTAERWFLRTCLVEVPGAGVYHATAKLSRQANEGEQFLACACINLVRYALKVETSPLSQVATVLEGAFGEKFPLADLRPLRSAYDRGRETMPSFEKMRPTWAGIVSALDPQTAQPPDTTED